MNRISISIILFWFNVLCWSQIPTGTWTTHYSYDEGTSVTRAKDRIFAVGSGFLFSYGLNDNAITTYSKINGLNDVGIVKVKYDDAQDVLFIGYENGNIDLLYGDKIVNIQDIKLASINGSKNINNVTFDNNIAYISSDVGVVVLDLQHKEVVETYILSDGSSQNPANGVAVKNGNIYVATDNGIYMCNLDNPNILDFGKWKLEMMFPEYNRRYAEIVNFKNNLVAVRADSETSAYTAYVLKTDGTIKTILSGGNNFRNISLNDSVFIAVASYKVYIFSEELNLVDNISSYNFENMLYDGLNSLASFDAVRTDENTYFVSDLRSGLVKYSKADYSEMLKPDGPASNTIWNMNINDGIVRMVHGALDGSSNNYIRPAEASVINTDGSWTIINKYTVPEIGNNAIDFVSIASDPFNPDKFYVGSFNYGLYEFEGGSFLERYTDANSPITNIIPGKVFYRVHSLVFDDNGTLWMSNSEVHNSILTLSQDGVWNTFNYPPIDDAGSDRKVALGNMIIAQNGTKWLVVPRADGGIFAFNENGTLDNSADDNYRMLSVNMDIEGKEFAIAVACIAEDKDGSIWFGTNNGLGVYSAPENVFDGDAFLPSRIKLPRENDEDDAADYLLDSEVVKAIAVDGGNRKWLGTGSSGLFLVSPDGLTTIHHFTKTNSPLPSNSISSIAIDPESGEVFIGTGAGLVSFGGDATAGNSDFSDIKAFPNPVRENFTGVVTISGLVEETIVKITDISGNLVFETVSNGGSVSWNRKNMFGEYVGTGVYMIFCATKDGEQSAITKLLVINSKQ
ncbi:two-component regulator propeller domain-containing protein [Saccharicrinis sp. FJH54]|uniref:type IX secretion system anionic LPS delivery protein PorZ n=1 Tax=Saccharicrinis sp. FJH54 TaxID=3344665 RepID=UPI0035D3E13A